MTKTARKVSGATSAPLKMNSPEHLVQVWIERERKQRKQIDPTDPTATISTAESGAWTDDGRRSDRVSQAGGTVSRPRENRVRRVVHGLARSRPGLAPTEPGRER